MGRFLSPVRILGLTAVALVAAMMLLIIFSKPSDLRAESSMEISNGVLVRYDIKDGMTQVSIPASVRAIGNEVFMGDKTLERIYIPGTVKTIGSKAFYGCDHLMEINLQDGTEEIKDSAFAMCTGLSRASLPSSLRKLGNGVFAGDTALNDFRIAEGNRQFFINDNVIYDAGSTRVIEMVPGRQADYYEMPFSVKSIAPYAFWGAEHLKGVRVSNNVISITPFAFTNAFSLEYVYLPNSVKSIQEYAFRDCKSLKHVVAEGRIDYIDKSAFSGMTDEIVPVEGLDPVTAEKKYGKDTSGTGSGKTGEKAEKDKEKSPGKEAVSADKTEKEEGDSGEKVEDGGNVVFNTPWGINAPYKDIDKSDPNLYGMGKIVGGRTLIIPSSKQNYKKVSGNGKQ